MLHYIDEEDIQLETIASEFPSVGEQRYLFVNDDRRSFKQRDALDYKYVLYSNIFNNFKKQEINTLETRFKLKREFTSNGIFIRLYEK